MLGKIVMLLKIAVYIFYLGRIMIPKNYCLPSKLVDLNLKPNFTKQKNDCGI